MKIYFKVNRHLFNWQYMYSYLNWLKRLLLVHGHTACIFRLSKNVFTCCFLSLNKPKSNVFVQSNSVCLLFLQNMTELIIMDYMTPFVSYTDIRNESLQYDVASWCDENKERIRLQRSDFFLYQKIFKRWKMDTCLK